MSQKKGSEAQFRRELRQYFRDGGSLREGIVIKDTKKKIKVTDIPSVDANKATMNAKILEGVKVNTYISFDTGIGNGSNITVDSDGVGFTFALSGMYQFIATIETNDVPPFDFEIERTPKFEPTLATFTKFDLVKNNIVVTMLPVHAGDVIKFKLSGINILPGTQVLIVRVSNI